MEQRLIRLLKLNFDLDDFYSITISPSSYPEQITLQGWSTPEKLLKYTKLGFSFDNNGHRLESNVNKVRIVLT